ncbi:hypothetical protein FJ656_16485, partial [Schumannella luteola]
MVAGGETGAHPGQHEREQVGGVVDGRGLAVPVLHETDRGIRIAAVQRRLGEPPEGGAHPLQLLHPPSEFEGTSQVLAGQVEAPAGELHVAEHLEGLDLGGDAVTIRQRALRVALRAGGTGRP